MNSIMIGNQQETSEKTDRSYPLAVQDLTVAYHRKPVLWDVGFNIPAGSLVGIVGPNGKQKHSSESGDGHRAHCIWESANLW